MKKFICFILCALSLNALEVDILSDFGINGLPAQPLDVKKEFDVHETATPDYFQKHSSHRPELAKIYDFISNMSSEKHQQYVETVKHFLASDQAKIFSPEFFDNLVYEAIQAP